MSKQDKLLAEALLAIKQSKGRDEMINTLARLVEEERQS